MRWGRRVSYAILSRWRCTPRRPGTRAGHLPLRRDVPCALAIHASPTPAALPHSPILCIPTWALAGTTKCGSGAHEAVGALRGTSQEQFRRNRSPRHFTGALHRSTFSGPGSSWRRGVQKLQHALLPCSGARSGSLGQPCISRLHSEGKGHTKWGRPSGAAP